MPKLESILTGYCQNLPKLTGEVSYFPSFLFAHLREYQSTIKSTKNFLESLYKNHDLIEREDTFLHQLDRIIEGLIQTTEAYLGGLPSEAYLQFRATINESYLKVALQKSQITHVKRGQNFYRVRTGVIPDPILPIELFHIPFENRKFVTSQRFSIPGYPCLYLGNSLSVCLKELDVFTDDRLANTKIARVTNNSNILIVDIDPYQMSKLMYAPIFGNNAKRADEIYQAALLYPIIAACHCKIFYTGDAKFKIEYIIPQLLLQWFKETKENKLIQGIRYLSNRIDKTNDVARMYNYVFPVIDCQKESGHCNNLKHLFKVSEGINVSTFPFLQTLFSDKVAELENHLKGLETQILP